MFDCVVIGGGPGGYRTAELLGKQLIQKCINICKCKDKDTVFVGDTENDRISAQLARVNFIGVTYGFEFNKEEEYTFLSANSIDEILSILL